MVKQIRKEKRGKTYGKTEYYKKETKCSPN
jgi:hypothetical protein